MTDSDYKKSIKYIVFVAVFAFVYSHNRKENQRDYLTKKNNEQVRIPQISTFSNVGIVSPKMTIPSRVKMPATYDLQTQTPSGINTSKSIPFSSNKEMPIVKNPIKPVYSGHLNETTTSQIVEINNKIKNTNNSENKINNTNVGQSFKLSNGIKPMKLTTKLNSTPESNKPPKFN